MEWSEIKSFLGSGMDQDSAPEDISPEDVFSATNIRFTGTSGQDLGYATNIESFSQLAGALLGGINNIIGGGKFDDTAQILMFRQNTGGNNQILLYSYATDTFQVIFTDLTNSGAVPFLPLNPQNPVFAILINGTYAVWWAKGLEVGYTNLKTLAAGGYGSTLLWEDLSLLKPQCMIPPTWSYGTDLGKSTNLLYGVLPQFTVQYVNVDYNKSAWSTRSSRAVPFQQNTPVLGQDVRQNNYIIIAVNAGSARVVTINIAVQFDDSSRFSILRSVNTSTFASLPTAVNVATEVYEAYNPGTNTYYYAWYNNSLLLPVDSTETDLSYDYIWQANVGVQINGNIIGIGDYSTLYPRPITQVTVAAVGFNPNITIPATLYANPLVSLGDYPGASGSGAGDHRRNMWIAIGGSPNAGDTIVIITADIRNASATRNYSHLVVTAEAGNLLLLVQDITLTLQGSYATYGSGYIIYWTDIPYYGLQTYAIELYFAGASVANSVPVCLDNTVVQLALGYRDYKARYFPLCTDNTYIVNLPSFAQQNGNASQISIQINSPAAPAGAFDYQILSTKPPPTKVLETIATLIVYKGYWNAQTNKINGGGTGLSVNTGNIGDTYQITVPSSPAAPSGSYFNIGHNDTYNTGDYVTNIGGSDVLGGSNLGQYYAVLPRTFGNLAGLGSGTAGILAISINSLALLNNEFAQENVTTNLVYNYAAGDRCTFQYWIPTTGGIGTFVVTPGSGYTNGTYTGVTLSGGTGSGAVATIVVAGNKVTNVIITTLGTGFKTGDTNITGTVAGGSGWFLTITQLAPFYFNNPCIDLPVLGYDAGTFIVKVENSAALTYSGGHVYYNGNQIDVRNIFIRLYSPGLSTESASVTINEQVWYEVGQRYPVTGGNHSVLNFNLIDGGAYFKTRQFPDAIQPYVNQPIQVLATDLNYSDFYVSPYHSFGRARTFNDELVQSEQAANIVTSQPYILGSQNNGLTRVYPQTVYGNANGQSSSSKGPIQIMEQIGSEIIVLQALGVFKIPVNIAYTVLNQDDTLSSNVGILLNNGIYDPAGVGVGLTKCYCRRYGRLFFVDPNKSLPYMFDGSVQPIAGKMSTYFKNIIQLSYSLGIPLRMYYNDRYEETVFTIQSQNGVLVSYPFSIANWNPFNSYVIVPGNVSATPNGSHSVASYNGATGVVTYTPSANYIGNDTATFTFNPGSGNVTLNNCLQWLAGNTTVNPFVFMALTNQPLSTVVYSNSITVSGPNIAVAISITGAGGQYQITTAAGPQGWTSSAGTVVSGNTVQVRTTTSGSNSTAVSVVLTIGAQTGTFTATTLGAASGNYNVQTNYGITISSIVNGTCTGTPALPGLPISPGQQTYAAYTSVTAGTVIINYTGSPAIPGHTYFGLNQNGIQTSSVLIDGSGMQSLTFTGTTNDPTPISVYVYTS